MSRKLVVYQNTRCPYSVLFPEVHQLVRSAIVRRFHILELCCVKTLLSACAEILTQSVIALPEHLGTEIPFLDLEHIQDWIYEARVENLVNRWYNKISLFGDPDIVQITYPKIFEFVHDQILLKEPAPFYISQYDLSTLTILLVRNTTVPNNSSIWSLQKAQITCIHGHWFTAVE